MRHYKPYIYLLIIGTALICVSWYSMGYYREDSMQASRLAGDAGEYGHRILPDHEEDFIEVLTKEESLEAFLEDIDVIRRVRCPIFTFCKAVNETTNEKLEFWKRAWYSAGFQPYVLTEKDALSRPEYGSLVSKIPSLELHAGYMRWLALSSVQSGLYSEVEVIPLEEARSLFEDYRASCQVSTNITIHEELGLRLFLFQQDEVKKLVKRLAHEPMLKGADQVWIDLKRKEYKLEKVRTKLPVISLHDPTHAYRHKRSLQLSDADQLMVRLKRINFMNHHRIFVVGDENANLASRLLETFKKIEGNISFDVDRIMPNSPFKQKVEKAENLLKFVLASKEDKIKDFCVVLITEPSQIIPVISPNAPEIARDAALRILKGLLKSGQVVFVPVREDEEKNIQLLEYTIGFPLATATCPKDVKTDLSADGRESLSKELYDLILAHRKAELIKLSEFE